MILEARVAAGMELLGFLADRLGLTRRAAKRLLDERGVFVNGRRVWMARHRLVPGDRVEARRAASPAASLPAVPVLSETPDAVVADKPPGLLSNDDPRSVEALLRRARREPALSAVHRLDRETSGCLWLARSPAARASAVEAFRAGRVRKVYEAIVLGAYPRARAVLDSPIEGRPALTRVERIAVAPRASRLRIVLETGRTHQIRRHLLEAGFPVAGDKQYGASRALDADLREVPRQMLHAAGIEARRADGSVFLRASAPPPPDFRAAWKRLGRPLPGVQRPSGRRTRST